MLAEHPMETVHYPPEFPAGHEEHHGQPVGQTEIIEKPPSIEPGRYPRPPDDIPDNIQEAPSYGRQRYRTIGHSYRHNAHVSTTTLQPTHRNKSHSNVGQYNKHF